MFEPLFPDIGNYEKKKSAFDEYNNILVVFEPIAPWKWNLIISTEAFPT